MKSLKAESRASIWLDCRIKRRAHSGRIPTNVDGFVYIDLLDIRRKSKLALSMPMYR